MMISRDQVMEARRRYRHVAGEYLQEQGWVYTSRGWIFPPPVERSMDAALGLDVAHSLDKALALQLLEPDR